jgi:hypothetical protein
MDQNFWGPPLWVYLHTLALNTPDKVPVEKQRSLERFFRSLGKTLPCSYCRDSYKVFYEKMPVTAFLNTRLGLSYWVYRLHDLVNQKIRKGPSPPFYKVLKKYEKARVSKEGALNQEKIVRAEQRYKRRADHLLGDFDPTSLWTK